MAKNFPFSKSCGDGLVMLAQECLCWLMGPSETFIHPFLYLLPPALGSKTSGFVNLCYVIIFKSSKFMSDKNKHTLLA